ncbi:uncharacterized protein LOC133832798 [Humulus lupulus]|uniref:uncharacterized protein LOC133832798 n=1 Tax=Humulus lupulus TaxID=3486 RepID=UPI002B40A83C|nr:uncharacterized protein LOC133832798 [Humulus lupulus]
MFPHIYEGDGVYLYPDSTNDRIMPNNDTPLHHRFLGDELDVQYRARTGLFVKWKEWNASISTCFYVVLKSVNILSSMFLSSGPEVYHDIPSLNQLVSRWCPTTHTFLTNWGEFSITLEDFYTLLFLPICGTASTIAPSSDEEKSLMSSLKASVESLKKNKKQFDLPDWVRKFHKEDGRDLVEWAAGIALWLSRYVFHPKNSRTVQSDVFPLACKLACGQKIPLGALYLGILYHNLDSLVLEINSKSTNIVSTVDACFLQMFIWERFAKLSPLRKCFNSDNPRPWSWARSRPKKSVKLCDIIDKVSEFTFCPYLTNIDIYFTLDLYPGGVVSSTEDVRLSLDISLGGIGFWFAICLPRHILYLLDNAKSASWSFTAYCLDHVARQFGFEQHVPHHRKLGDLEKPNNSCLLNYLQSSKCSRTLFCLPCKMRHGGVSSKFVDLWLKELENRSSKHVSVHANVHTQYVGLTAGGNTVLSSMDPQEVVPSTSIDLGILVE